MFQFTSVWVTKKNLMVHKDTPRKKAAVSWEELIVSYIHILYGYSGHFYVSLSL